MSLLPICLGGGVHGWGILDGPAQPRAGGGGSGRKRRGGRASVRGGAFHGPSLGDRGPRGGAARGQADARWTRAAHRRRGRSEGRRGGKEWRSWGSRDP